MPEKLFDVIQIIPANPGCYVWTIIDKRTVIDPVFTFALVEFRETGKHAVFPMVAEKDGVQLVVVEAGGILDYRPPIGSDEREAKKYRRAR